MSWISVEDRLPKEQVIAYSKNHKMYMIGNIIKASESTKQVSPDIFICEKKYGAEWLSDISHWMPLPEPPTE